MKKLILGALAALCAMLALPALASATPAHVTPLPEGVATVHGGESELSRSGGGGSTTGVTTTGTAVFDNTTTGRLKLTFHGVKSFLGTNCESEGQPTGTVTTTELTFHIVMLPDGKPGILITGNKTVPTPSNPNPVLTAGEGSWGHHFVDFTCGIFIPTIQVTGNGILGTITAPACDKNSTTATVEFDPTEPGNGIQKHGTYTGTSYSLESAVGGGEPVKSAMEAEATITFANNQNPMLDCTP